VGRSTPPRIQRRPAPLYASPVVHRHRSTLILFLAVGLAGALSGCGGASESGTGASSDAAATAHHVALPATSVPSISARKVCHSDAIHDISSALGVTPVTVTAPTWVQHLYSCQYRYHDGTLTLSVKELDDKAQTTAYFDELGHRLGDTGRLTGLGQGAFSTIDGSVVVRKDYKVLLVDIAGLPNHFGVPPSMSSDIAVTVADVIMGCWTGA
jgi:hypothetical protein